MEEKQVFIKNQTVNYKVFGQGEPFLILHGWGSKSDRWQQVAEKLAEHKLKILVPDLPGFGKSQAPGEPWTLNSYVEWIREFSLAVPELKKEFYVLGHSFGGNLAAKFCIKYNQQVKKLYLVSSSCLRTVSTKKKLLAKFSKIAKVFSFVPYYPQLRKGFYKYIIRRSDYPYVEGVMKETYLNVIAEDLSLKLSFVRVPTVIIWGDKDALTPVTDAKRIHEKIRNSKLIVLPGFEHSLQIQAPDLLTEKIVENL